MLVHVLSEYIIWNKELKLSSSRNASTNASTSTTTDNANLVTMPTAVSNKLPIWLDEEYNVSREKSYIMYRTPTSLLGHESSF
jgi:hypothetical protein